MYIHSDEWPSCHDIQIQRLQPAVLEAQTFEMMLKVLAARTYRINCQNENNQYGSFWPETENIIADQIHCIWLTGYFSKQETIQMALTNLQSSSFEDIQNVYERMTETDEFLLQTKAPFLTKIKTEELLAYKNNKTPQSLIKKQQKRGSTSAIATPYPKRKRSLVSHFDRVSTTVSSDNVPQISHSTSLSHWLRTTDTGPITGRSISRQTNLKRTRKKYNTRKQREK